MGMVCHDQREAQEKRSEERTKRRRFEDRTDEYNTHSQQTQKIQRMGENVARRIANKQQQGRDQHGTQKKKEIEKTMDRLRCSHLSFFLSVDGSGECESCVQERL